MSLTHLRPVAQQITTFSPDFSYAPDNATEFFSPEVRKKWTDLVPSTSKQSADKHAAVGRH